MSAIVCGALQFAPGAVLRKQYRVSVPPDTRGGAGTLQIRLLDGNGVSEAEPVALGPLTISVPTRTFTAPAIESPLTARFGEGIHLLGYRAPATVHSGASLPMTLYWKSTAVLAERYTVFIHLLDAEGHIVTQIDSQPTQGARPTSGWLPPEIITDEHTLTLPADLPLGPYRLAIGLYDPRTGIRVPISTAEGAITDRLEVSMVLVTAP